MKVIRTKLDGVCVVEPHIFGDARGFFYETWNAEKFAAAGLKFNVVQANVSRSQYGVLRGLHYQWPNPQGKFVTVTEGEVFDVAVDIRTGSPNFGHWEACVLNSENKRHFWIPEGFAHGFVVLSEHATFSYLCSATYQQEADAAVRWDDPQIAIDWPIKQPQLSGKDAQAPLLSDITVERLPVYTK